MIAIFGAVRGRGAVEHLVTLVAHTAVRSHEARSARWTDVDIERVSGEVELLLDPDVSADIQVSSFSGEIENDFGPEAESVSRYTSEKELRFETGGGDARISIETLSGNVYLRRR